MAVLERSPGPGRARMASERVHAFVSGKVRERDREPGLRLYPRRAALRKGWREDILATHSPSSDTTEINLRVTIEWLHGNGRSLFAPQMGTVEKCRARSTYPLIVVFRVRLQVQGVRTGRWARGEREREQ